jgi:HAD superfamily phosphoserine phosphatase-like hydrolase
MSSLVTASADIIRSAEFETPPLDAGTGSDRENPRYHPDEESPPLIEVAAFDIDGTLTRRDVEESLILKLIKEDRLFGTAIKLLFLSALRTARRPPDFESFKEGVWSSFAEVSDERLAEAINSFKALSLPALIKPAAVAEIEFCRAAGWKVVLVTGAINPLAEAIATLVCADHVIGTSFRIDAGQEGLRLRRADVNTGPSKVRRLTEWADSTFGRGAWRFRRAYSDHHSDLPLLSSVSEPVAVCPTWRLRAVARRRSWQIVEW